MGIRIVPFRYDRRLSKELATQRRSIIIGLVCTAVTSGLYASTIWLTKVATKSIEDISSAARHGIAAGLIRAEQPFRTLSIICLIFIAVMASRYWFTRGQTYYLSEAANKLAADLKIRLFKKLMSLPVSYFNDRRAGSIQSVLTNDVNVYQNAVSVIRDSIDGPVKAGTALVLIFIIQWRLALLAILVMPVMVLYIQRNSRRMRVAQLAVQNDLAEVAATTQEVLQGARVVKAFGAEDRMDVLHRSLVGKSLKSQMVAVARVASLRPMVDLLGAVALAITLYMGGVFASQGTLDVSHIVAMAFALDTINRGFKSLAGVSNTLASVQGAADRIYSEVLDVAVEHEAEGGKTLEHPVGRVAFECVSFSYPDGTEALHDVSFAIEPGTSLALVGPSGSGKTTIADLLLRFYDPLKGRITFDGVDVKELNVRWLRTQFGVVPQQTFLFAGTVEENVRLGRPDASDADVKLALEQAHAKEFASEVAGRDDSDLGERGVRLSGGQMQRVAIARALVRKPTVLVLDEATSSLDATSERAVNEALDVVMKDRTTLFIAHRLTTAARADRILVLSKGEVVETGSHDQLLEANGPYAALFRAFSGGVLG